jgi:hypothetical protein
MKVPYDVVLPQVSVLRSTMAYREAGNLEAPVALFLHGKPTSSTGSEFHRAPQKRMAQHLQSAELVKAVRCGSQGLKPDIRGSGHCPCTVSINGELALSERFSTR